MRSGIGNDARDPVFTRSVDANGNDVGAGGGGGGGAVTIADGADVSQGATTDAAYTDTTGAAAGRVVGLLKGLYAAFRTAGSAQVSVAAQASAADGTSNAAYGRLVPTGGGATNLGVFNLLFNGTGWDRQRGDTNGAYTVSKGSGTLATAQVAVTTSAAQIVAARAGRGSVKIQNLGTTDIYLGNTGVTTATGDLLVGTKGASVTIPTTAAIFAIGAAAGSVSVMEVY